MLNMGWSGSEGLLGSGNTVRIAMPVGINTENLQLKVFFMFTK
jgi:hypothetical protein